MEILWDFNKYCKPKYFSNLTITAIIVRKLYF